MVRPKEESGELRRRLILSDTHLSLESGYDVILDGIFHLRVYSDFFTELFDTHSKDNYAFYFDVSLDETLRRHQTRPQQEKFDADAMKQWFTDASPLGRDIEYTVSESSTLKQTVEFIRETAGLL
jgi:hypothetical protein